MAYPNLRQTIWLLFLFVVIQVGLTVAVLVVDRWKFEDDFLLGILMLANFVILLGYVHRRTDLDWRYIRPLFNTRFDWRIWPCVAISVVGLGMLDTELMKVAIRIAPVPEWMQEIYRSEILRKTSFLSAVFGAAVIAPLGEELLFRGIILSGLLAHHSRVCAVLLSAVLFGMLHLDPWTFVPIFISGMVWAWWVIRTGSLLPALFGHALNNLIAVAILHSDISDIDISGDLNDVAFNPWWFSAAGVALAAVGLRWFSRVAKPAEPGSEGEVPTEDPGTDATPGLVGRSLPPK